MTGAASDTLGSMSIPMVVVGGVHKGAGKTTLACYLLSRLPGWGGLKVTTTHEGTVCPVEASCTACGEVEGPYLVVRDRQELDREGTDTWKMRRDGAARVVWLRATPEHLAEGMEEVLPDFAGLPGIVVEGTNVARHRGHLYLLAARPPIRKIKPSARATVERADWTVLNFRPGWVGGGTDLLRREMPAFFRRPPLPFRGADPDAADNAALFETVRSALASRT